MAIQTHYETIVILAGGKILAPATGAWYTVPQRLRVTNATPYGAAHWQFTSQGIRYIIHTRHLEWQP